MFKLALNAGHGYSTPGKRCLKAVDPNETREYVLNKRVCDKLETLLSAYDGIEVLRIDDGSEMSITQRTNKANAWGADLYLAVHHNAGIYGRSGGGIMAFVYLFVDKVTLAWRDDFYNSLIAHTGLSGNRALPLSRSNLGECRQTKMPAVLLELGFMDSTVDTPIILTEAYADKCAAALCETIVKRESLIKKASAAPSDVIVSKSVDEVAREVLAGKWGNGDERKAKLASAGYDYDTVQAKVNKLVNPAPVRKSNTEIAREVIRGDWGNGAERKQRLAAAGYNHSEIQKIVNKLSKKR